MSDKKRVKIHIGTTGRTSRVLVDGKEIAGVNDITVKVLPSSASVVRVSIYANTCEIVQEDFDETL